MEKSISPQNPTEQHPSSISKSWNSVDAPTTEHVLFTKKKKKLQSMSYECIIVNAVKINSRK